MIEKRKTRHTVNGLDDHTRWIGRENNLIFFCASHYCYVTREENKFVELTNYFRGVFAKISDVFGILSFLKLFL